MQLLVTFGRGLKPSPSAHLALSLSLLAMLSLGCEKPVVVSAGTPAVAGGVTFEVGDYSIQQLELHQGEESFEYVRPVLVIPVTVTNSGEGPITYSPTHSAPQMNELTTPLLYADPGPEAKLPPAKKTPISGVVLTKGRFPKQLDAAQTLNKGDSLTDYYLFELPSKDQGQLILSLPPAWHRGEVPALVRIAYAPKPAQGPKVYELKETIDFQGVSFTVDAAETLYVKTDDTAQGEGFSASPLLKISYTLINDREAPIIYEPNHRALSGAPGPRLFSSEEGAHKRVQFGPSTSAVGQSTGKTTLKPGEKRSDFVLFEQPTEAVTRLNLEVPATLFQGTGTARVAFDYTFSSPPKPAELTKKPAPSAPAETTP